MKTDLLVLRNLLQKERPLLRDRYSVKEIGIFGSYATGKNKVTSDIDILVELSKPISMFTFLDLEEHLSHVTGKKIDLATKKSLKPFIKKEILQSVIYV